MKLLEPITIRGVEFKNRVVMPPMTGWPRPSKGKLVKFTSRAIASSPGAYWMLSMKGRAWDARYKEGKTC